MCEYCQNFPHLAGCPNAPDPEPVRCPVCGRLVDGGEIEEGNGVCLKCRDKPREFEEYTGFLIEDLPGFLDWWYQEDYLHSREWSRNMQAKLCGYLFDRFCLEYLEGSEYDRKYILSMLRDYVRENREDWSRWLRENAS